MLETPKISRAGERGCWPFLFPENKSNLRHQRQEGGWGGLLVPASDLEPADRLGGDGELRGGSWPS